MMPEKRFRKHLKPTSAVKGQGMVEYIVLVSLIALAAIAIVAIFGGQEKKQFATMTHSLAGKDGVVDDSLSIAAREEEEEDPSLAQYDQNHESSSETGNPPASPAPASGPSDPAPPTPSPPPTPPAPPASEPAPPAPEPAPPAPAEAFNGNYSGTMFGDTITSSQFTTNGNQISGYMIIQGEWGRVRQEFSGVTDGTTATLHGTNISVISMRPGCQYNPDNLTLTVNPDGSISGGNAVCSGTGRTSAINLTRG